MVRRDDFLIGPKEKATEAIKAGRTEEALRYLDDVHEQFHKLHDAYCSHLSLLMGTLAELHGEEWYEEFDHKTITDLFTAKYSRWKDMSPTARTSSMIRTSGSRWAATAKPSRTRMPDE